MWTSSPPASCGVLALAPHCVQSSQANGGNETHTQDMDICMNSMVVPRPSSGTPFVLSSSVTSPAFLDCVRGS